MNNGVRVAHVTTVDLTLRFLLLAQLQRLRDEGYDVTTISQPGPWVAALEAQGIRHIPWPHATRSWNPRSDVLAFAELLKIFRRERFDLVHTHNPKPGLLGRVAARLTGTPCIVNTVHGFYATPEDRLVKKLPVVILEWLGARFSDVELYQSEEDLAWVSRMRLVSPRKRAFLGNGTDLKFFDPNAVAQRRVAELRRELEIADDALVVGCVGRLVAEKGYRELFEAARVVKREVPSVAFLVVGERDPEKADSLSLDEIDDVRQSITFTGWRTDVRDLLAIMDVFVLPSWREGLPRSAVEAAAMARPLILTDIRGCREVVHDGVEGFLVPSKSPGHLAQKITELLGNEERRRTFARAARARAVERFDEQHVAERILTSYASLLAKKGLAAPPSVRPGLATSPGVEAKR